MGRRVLVTGGRAPAALEWTRALAEAGHTVFVGDSFACTAAGFSRHCHRRLKLPPPRPGPSFFSKSVRSALRAHQIDLVIPTCEEVFYLAANPDAVFCSGLPLLRRLHSKRECLRLAEGHGVAIPQTELVQHWSQLPADPSRWVFKKEFSRFAEGTRVGTCRGLAPPLLVQQRLEGVEFSGYGLAYRGELKGWVTYRPLHRLGAASGVYFEPVELPQAAEFAHSLVSALDYHGQLAFDFIQSDGRLYVLECNPRATSGVHFFSSGLAEILEGREVQAQTSRCKVLTTALPLVRPFPSLPSLLRDLLRADDVVVRGDDPTAFLGLALHLLEAIARAVRHGVSLKTAMTWDLEWNGEVLA